MADLKRMTPRQRAEMSYMMDAMRRLEWDLHNSIEMTGRIPLEWHEIAKKPPHPEKVKVTLRLDRDVVKFFQSMGTDYGPRINLVLRSYLHGRLAGVIRGAETIDHFRNARYHHGDKPAFAAEDGEPPEAKRVFIQEELQRRYAEEGAPEPDMLKPWVR